MIDTLRTGDLVRYTVNGKTALTGVYITERDGMAVIKLESGYNIGASPEKIEFIDPGRPRQPPRPSRTPISRTCHPLHRRDIAEVDTGRAR